MERLTLAPTLTDTTLQCTLVTVSAGPRAQVPFPPIPAMSRSISPRARFERRLASNCIIRAAIISRML